MSTSEDKVTVVGEFLTNRAGLRRVTNYQEIGRVAGEQLYERGMRSISSPVRRDKIAAVLRAIDDTSFANNGYLLSALVTHFWDNNPGHRFYEGAVGRGMLPADASADDLRDFHVAQLQTIYADVPELIVASRVPDSPEGLADEQFEDEDVQSEV